MNGIRPGFLAGQESRADLCSLGPELEGGANSPRVSDSTGSNHRDLHDIGHLWDEGKRPHDRFLGGAQKRRPVPTRFKARS
jgi:hypothetical protein